jgi:hypothetical protein
MATGNSRDDYRVALIDIAREIAIAGTGATRISGGSDRGAFLRRFRAAYLHLVATIENADPSSALDRSNLTETDKLLADFEQGK